MNIKKSIIAGVLGLGLVSLADAATIYMSGSTAMRSTVYATLNAAGAVFDAAPTFAGRGGSSASGCNYMAFVGNIGGVSTTVKCHWSGSEAGIKDVATGQLEDYLADTVTGVSVPAPTAGELDPTLRASDLAMADNSQAFSRNTAPTLTTGTKVGIITFTWVRNPSTLWGTNANNVTDQQLRQALGGFAKLSLITGVPTDNTYVYVSGRDDLSGTRVNALGTSGFGIFTTPNQIMLNASGDMTDLSGAGDYAGDYGFTSGGTLAGTLGANTATKAYLFNGGTGFTVLSYLGRADANKAISLGAVELTLNGVAQSVANVKEGRYNYWGNAWLYQKNSAGFEAVAVYNKLANTTTGINNYCDGSNAIKLSDMHATRQAPTVDPVHN